MFEIRRITIVGICAAGLVIGGAPAGAHDTASSPAVGATDDSTYSCDEPAIGNGGFEQGLDGWRWNFSADTLGASFANGIAEVIADPTPDIDMSLRANQVLRLHSSSQALTPTQETLTGSTVFSQLQAVRVFNYCDGDALVVSAAIDFDMTLEGDGAAWFAVNMFLLNRTTGWAESVELKRFVMIWPCDTTVELSGHADWAEYHIDLASMDVDVGDEMEVWLSIEIDAQSNTIVPQVSVEAIIDDVRIADFEPTPAAPRVAADTRNTRTADRTSLDVSANGFALEIAYVTDSSRRVYVTMNELAADVLACHRHLPQP